MSAAARFAAMDFDATDGLSVDEMGIDYGWPEPGFCCLDELVTAQLYWPLLLPVPHYDAYYNAPDGDIIPFYRADGRLICWDCWKPYTAHPNDEREACLTVLCNGWRVKL